MNAIASSLLTSLAVTTLASCIPFPYAERLAEPMTGHVVDKAQQPVAGARIEYLYHGTHVVGTTTSRSDGSFSFGPFRQWFYLTYVGSPGSVPVPFRLERPGFPDFVRVTSGTETGVYARGSRQDFEAQVPERMRSRWNLSKVRWTSDGCPIMIAPEMHDAVP